MATLQAQNLVSSPSSSSCRSRICASLYAPKNRRIPIQKLPMLKINLEDQLSLREEHTATQPPLPIPCNNQDDSVISKLYAIAEAAADRAEMHDIIGEQRNNWGHLLLNSVNSITLTASLMAAISAIPPDMTIALKLSSALLFTAATGMMLITNKIQPSQLAEEQRNATRLFLQLERSIHTNLALVRAPTETDVEEAMEKVLALDKAYPLPLLPGMLEKFPEAVEPTVWWPKLNRRRPQQQPQPSTRGVQRNNGWTRELEEEMKGLLRVLKGKDTEEYVSFAKLFLQINRTLAISGPLLAGMAAVGAGLIGSPALGQWPALVGAVGGALATVVNTLEHGGQVGMVFELSRNCAGNYRQLEEEIEYNLGEREVERRENGDLFETKVALRLGRSLSEMKGLASYASSSSKDEQEFEEFAGKLF